MADLAPPVSQNPSPLQSASPYFNSNFLQHNDPTVAGGKDLSSHPKTPPPQYLHPTHSHSTGAASYHRDSGLFTWLLCKLLVPTYSYNALPYHMWSKLCNVFYPVLLIPAALQVEKYKKSKGQPIEIAVREAGLLVSDIQITGKPLGTGSYGEVVVVRVRGRMCAAKKLHGIFNAQDVPPKEKSAAAERFETECHRVLYLSHPNIIEMIGIHFDEAARLPTLVMELMNTSLCKYLENNPKSFITLPTKYSILHDVASGLLYLHSLPPPLGPIVHRDLTANDILLALASRVVAKIADLGQAKIDPVYATRQQQLSQLPGNEYHMPPEAWFDNPEYNASLDVFSFGVVILHTLTHEWPKPLGRLKSATEICPEVERRKPYLDKISDSPLKPVVEQCLSQLAKDRPSTSVVLDKFKACIAQLVCSNLLMIASLPCSSDITALIRRLAGPGPIQGELVPGGQVKVYPQAGLQSSAIYLHSPGAQFTPANQGLLYENIPVPRERKPQVQRQASHQEPPTLPSRAGGWEQRRASQPTGYQKNPPSTYNATLNYPPHAAGCDGPRADNPTVFQNILRQAISQKSSLPAPDGLPGRPGQPVIKVFTPGDNNQSPPSILLAELPPPITDFTTPPLCDPTGLITGLHDMSDTLVTVSHQTTSSLESELSIDLYCSGPGLQLQSPPPLHQEWRKGEPPPGTPIIGSLDASIDLYSSGPTLPNLNRQLPSTQQMK